MAKVISSLPGSTGILSRTSQLTNDGESGVSTYVELDDISTVATTGDYNNLINVPIDFTPRVHTHNISDISGTKSEFNTSLTDGDFLFVGDVLDTPDATVTTKGILKLTGDLGGTADNPTTPTAIHKIGDEIKHGILTLSDGLKIVGNTTSTTATKVNVQEANGTINTISKFDLVNVVEVNDVPSLPLVGVADKIYVVKNVNKIYRWNGTFYQELAGSDISGKEDIANKQNSLSVDGSNTKYPTVTAVNTGLGLKENILNNPITGVGSQNNANTYALQDGTVLYHSAKWFVPSGAVSTIGATVTSVGTQFTSEMVGAKLTINGEWRVITAYTNATNVTVASAYSANYSGVVAGSWGVYSKSYESTSTGVTRLVNNVGAPRLSLSGNTVSSFNLTSGGGGYSLFDANVQFGATTPIQWGSGGFFTTKDLGLRRNNAGVLEIYDGITATGLGANRRDLLARNLFGSKVLIGSIVDDNVNQGQYTGTVSSGTTALGNTPPTANNQLTRKDYVDTGLALKAPLASPSFTGTPTAPTAPAGTNTTQIATTAFVTNGIATADSQNVKLTGNQSITGTKTFNNSTSGTSVVANNTSTGTGIYSNNQSTGKGIHSDNNSTGISIYSLNYQSGNGIVSNQGASGTGFNYVGQNNGTNTFTVNKLGATTATSFIKSASPATNILLAGGGDIAQNTAFNKNFGTTAGTVVEGGTLGSNAYNSTAYLPLTGGTVNGLLKITRDGSQLSLTGTDQASFDMEKTGGYKIRMYVDANNLGFYNFNNGLIPFEISNTTAIVNFSRIPTAPTAIAGTNTTQIATTAFVLANSSARPYKVYTALLTQSGTNAPVATVLENTLGGMVVWARTSLGTYTGTLAGAFTLNKVGILFGSKTSPNHIVAISSDVNTITIFTNNSSGALTEGVLQTTTFEIKVYN